MNFSLHPPNLPSILNLGFVRIVKELCAFPQP